MRLAHQGYGLGEDDPDRVADLHRLLVRGPLEVDPGNAAEDRARVGAIWSSGPSSTSRERKGRRTKSAEETRIWQD